MSRLAVEQIFDQAVEHHRSGRLPEAERLYRQILASDPAHANTLQNLGLLAHQSGHTLAAVDLFRAAISQKPDFPEAHNNLGNAMRDLGRLDEALTAYRGAIALRPTYAEAHYNLGVVYLDQRLLDASVAAFRTAINLAPHYPEAHNNLGLALRDQGCLDDAVVVFNRAIAIKPDFFEAHSNLGTALREQGLTDAAIESYQRALVLRPRSAELLNNLGIALAAQGEINRAIATIREAVLIPPDNSGIHSNLIFTLYYDPASNSKIIADELRLWDSRHARPLQKFWQPHSNDPSPNRGLRIGYVSPDFRDHAVARNLLPLFQRHDHQQFEIFCYSNTPRHAEMTTQFQQNADHWRDIAPMSDDSAASQIRSDQIDILVDLALHTAGNRLCLFARKPAPIQVTFAGYPGSTGLSAMDYRLTDPYLDPPEIDRSAYVEQTIRLPNTFWCYDPLETRDVSVNSLPAEKSGVFTFGCLNKILKINDSVLALWAQVMRQVEDSRLVLLATPGSHRQRILEKLSEHAIAPNRVEFLSPSPRLQYMQYYHRIDLGLDTFPYNGHTTSLDSLWMGVPVVTLVGQMPVSRAGWSQLSNLGMPELAASDADTFVRIAAGLAKGLPRLGKLRSILRGRMEQSPLMDAACFAQRIESAYRQMWRTWLASK